MKRTMIVWAAIVLSAAARAPSAGAAGDAPAGVVTGYRGVSMSIQGHQMAFLKKEDRIDVMLTFDAVIKAGKEKVTATILQNVVVLDVRKPEKLDARGVVEILCNPNEAQYVALSGYQGELSLAIRSEGDTKLAPMEMASLRKLFR